MTDTAPSAIVVMAVYRPNEAHLAAQTASVAAQTQAVERVVAVIADRASRDLVERLAGEAGLALDCVVPEIETGSARSFEIGLARALEIAPEGAVFALCDQDDIWHPEKLARCAARLAASGAGLVHSDARVVGPEGDVRHPSLAGLERRMRRPGLRDLLLRNTVTGMTAMVTADVARAALPFPPQAALFFHHDLWLALVAMPLGGVVFEDRALVDYRQHGGNVVGAVESRAALPRFGSAAWRRHWAGSYSVAAYLAKSLYLRMGEVAAAGQVSPDRDVLARLAPYLARRRPGGAFLTDAVRHLAALRPALARQTAMFFLVRSARLIWALRRSLPPGLIGALAEFDRRAFAMAPGAQPGQGGVPDSAAPAAPEPERWRAEAFRDARTLCRFKVDVSPARPGGMVIVVPTLNPAEIFAGIATALDIGVGLAARGVRVTFLASDLPVASVERTMAFVAGRPGGARIGARVRIVCGVTEREVSFSAADRFLATAWWSAHVIDAILRKGDFTTRRFHYLIQDYEPGFYPWGAEFAGALASYRLDYTPIFNSEPLRAHFEAEGLTMPDAEALTFHPAIDVARYASLTRPRPLPGRPRRLALYGRPEVPRNLFPTAIDALARFLSEEGVRPDEIDLVSVGLAHPEVRLGGGHRIRSLGKIPWDDYPQFLAGVDVGLSLMLSPHPSHPPLEMAAAGARVVTNGFGPKDLGRLTPAILSVAPTAPEIATALALAWRARPVARHERRFALTALGAPLDTVIDRLAAEHFASSSLLAAAG